MSKPVATILSLELKTVTLPVDGEKDGKILQIGEEVKSEKKEEVKNEKKEEVKGEKKGEVKSEKKGELKSREPRGAWRERALQMRSQGGDGSALTPEEQHFCEKELEAQEQVNGEEKDKKYLICAEAAQGKNCRCHRAHNVVEYDLRICRHGNDCTHPVCHFWHPKDVDHFYPIDLLCRNSSSCEDPHCPFMHGEERRMQLCKYDEKCQRRWCLFRHTRDQFKYSKYFYNLHCIMRKKPITSLTRIYIMDSLMKRLAYHQKKGTLKKEMIVQTTTELLSYF